MFIAVEAAFLAGEYGESLQMCIQKPKTGDQYFRFVICKTETLIKIIYDIGRWRKVDRAKMRRRSEWVPTAHSASAPQARAYLPQFSHGQLVPGDNKPFASHHFA